MCVYNSETRYLYPENYLQNRLTGSAVKYIYNKYLTDISYILTLKRDNKSISYKAVD